MATSSGTNATTGKTPLPPVNMLGTVFFPGTGGKERMKAYAAETLGGAACMVQVQTPAHDPGRHPDGYRNFGCYKTWPDCLTAMEKILARVRHVFEIIQHGVPCNGYLDLDGKPPLPPGCDTVAAVVARAEDLVRRIYQEDFAVPKLPASAFIWLHSPNQEKLSLHLIIRTKSPQYVFRSNHQDDPHGACQLAMRIKQLDPQGLGQLVDLGVYSRDREMRMVYSSKISKKDSVLVPLRPVTAVQDTIITMLDEDVRSIEVPAFLPRSMAHPAAPRTPQPSDVGRMPTPVRQSSLDAARMQPSTAQPTVTQGSLLDEVREVMGCLSSHRAETYDLWIRLGWCLHNINRQELLQDWITFSKRSSKFQDGECGRLWATMRNEGLGIGSLHKWAMEDSPAEYRAIISKRVADDLMTCDGSHNAVAQIAHKLLSGRIVCASADGNLWYMFDGTRWVEDEKGMEARKALSGVVREHVAQGICNISLSTPPDDSASVSTRRRTSKEQEQCTLLNTVSFKLRDAHFKDSVVREMREFFYDRNFLDKLDTDPNLLGFNNGVWDLKEHRFRPGCPEDYISLTVGYNYTPKVDEAAAADVASYWKRLHPDAQQREYVQRMLSRQLYGDACGNYLHVHAGHNASAASGKTSFFEVLSTSGGSYVRKFGVEVLTAKQRPSPGKPMPELAAWRGARIMFCTEPNAEDVLHTGILKDLTGGERIQYRLLFSNTIREYVPMWALHLMCNNAPRLDGGDQGVQRRIRKVDYRAMFVEPERVCEEWHMYPRDTSFMAQFATDDRLKMEFLHVLLGLFTFDYAFPMPAVVSEAGKEYLADNDVVHSFIVNYLEPDAEAYFMLKQAKAIFTSKPELRNAGVTLAVLKTSLVAQLNTPCIPEKTIAGHKARSVFMGYRLVNVDADQI